MSGGVHRGLDPVRAELDALIEQTVAIVRGRSDAFWAGYDSDRDPRLLAVWEVAGTVEPRITAPGFAGIAKVICGQQLSVTSAAAIWSRFGRLPGALDPVTYLDLDEETVRGIGFSAGKYRTVRVIAASLS